MIDVERQAYMTSFYPQYDLAGRIQHTKLDTGFSDMPSARMTRVENQASPDFKQVMSGLVENLNTELNAPDDLLKDVMIEQGYNIDPITHAAVKKYPWLNKNVVYYMLYIS